MHLQEVIIFVDCVPNAKNRAWVKDRLAQHNIQVLNLVWNHHCYGTDLTISAEDFLVYKLIGGRDVIFAELQEHTGW